MPSHLDMKGVKSLKGRLRGLEVRKVKWGYFEGQHSSAGMSYAALANLLEEGTRSSSGGYGIPPRPAFKDSLQSVKHNRSGFERALQGRMSSFVRGVESSPAGVHNLSGTYLKNRYQDSMDFWIMGGSQYQHNAPGTVALKGKDKPFDETGELIRNATFRVV